MKKENKNNHLKDYIEYYITQNEPMHAVLVTGEWGVGKTHQVKKIIKNEDMCYISLFGLSSTAEIYTSIYAKMFPIKAKVKKTLNIFSSSSLKIEAVTLPFLGIIGNAASAFIKEKVDKNKIIVFDDLERCTSIVLDDILGVINSYVEHHKCRVIVIAHDETIKNKIATKKEKIFGQIVKAEPDIEDAFSFFIQKSKMPSAIEPIKQIIYKSFIASECKSLRVLEHTINDCARLLSVIKSNHLENTELIEELFYFYTSIVIGFRAGMLSSKDLLNREMVYYKFNLNDKDNASENLIKIQETYKKNGIDIVITTNLITETDLINCIENGFIDTESVNKTISNSNYYHNKIKLGPWFDIMHFDEIETHKVVSSIKELKIKINNFDVTEPGEILHSFNLLFLLSTIGQIDDSIKTIYNDAINYIKKLQKLNKIPSSKIIQNTQYMFGEAAFSYGFWVQDEYRDESNSLKKALNKEMEIAFQKRFPEFILEIKEAIKTEPLLFCSMITAIQESQGKYANIAILARIKPYEFVDLWLLSDKKHWQKIRTSLNSRYSGGTLSPNGYLEQESKWLKAVKMNLRHRASNKEGIDRLRILRLLPE
ncbi:MAG: P-loop NTPase fold protein [Hafnia alvei]|uniref:P-loop NTPase fold protein n=1 Tax=Hafnia alvei TaxID=569 RepID=UPI003F8E349D